MKYMPKDNQHMSYKLVLRLQFGHIEDHKLLVRKVLNASNYKKKK